MGNAQQKITALKGKNEMAKKFFEIIINCDAIYVRGHESYTEALESAKNDTCPWFITDGNAGFIFGNREAYESVNMYKLKKEILAEKIEAALWEKWREARCRDFTLRMKGTGNVINVSTVKTGARKSMGHWRCGSIHFEVSGDGIEEKRYFNVLGGLAKAIAYGFIK